MKKIYTGIGSRSTPANVCLGITRLAQHLTQQSWLLRSGNADGADQAFEKGSAWPYMEIYLPWSGFCGRDGSEKGFCVPQFDDEMRRIAQAFHPNWAMCNSTVRKMHMRNVCQVLGLDCNTPTTMVVCWTQDGKIIGGTAQAIRIAKGYDIPVFNVAHEAAQHELFDFLKQEGAALAE